MRIHVGGTPTPWMAQPLVLDLPGGVAPTWGTQPSPPKIRWAGRIYTHTRMRATDTMPRYLPRCGAVHTAPRLAVRAVLHQPYRMLRYSCSAGARAHVRPALALCPLRVLHAVEAGALACQVAAT